MKEYSVCNSLSSLASVTNTFTEEMLIDFGELEGAHTGSNLADAVWETLKRYKIEDWIMAFMADNASNNDTMIDGIVALALEDEKAIQLNAQWIRMRCMPHTVHLAALKVCSSKPISASINVLFPASGRCWRNLWC